MQSSRDLPACPVAPWEWRPSREPTFAERSNLPPGVDDTVGAYPVREVIGRLLSRGPVGAADRVVVALHDGSVFTYGGYVQGPSGGRRDAVDKRIRAVLDAGGQSGAVIAAVGRRRSGRLEPVPPGTAGELCGVVFDLALSTRARVLSSPLLALDGQYLVRELRIGAVDMGDLDPALPGASVVAAMRSSSRWPVL